MVKNILYFTLAVFGTLILVELFIQTSHIVSVAFTEFYDDIGRGRKSNFDYVFFNEGFAIGRLNEYRYLGNAFPPEKTENTTRVALIGDSYTEAFHVFQRHHFATLTENILNTTIENEKIEVLNFGQAGFDIADMYSQHKILVENFAPDYILYMISRHDLEPNYRDRLRPNTYLNKDSLIISFDYPAEEYHSYVRAKGFIQNSSILNMINMGHKKARETSVSKILFDKFYLIFYPEPKDDGEGIPNVPSFTFNPVSKAIIENLDPEKVIFVNRGFESLPDELEQYILSRGFDYLDLSKPMKHLKNSGLDPRYWHVTETTGHWNHAAHQLVAQELADFLTPRIKEE